MTTTKYFYRPLRLKTSTVILNLSFGTLIIWGNYLSQYQQQDHSTSLPDSFSICFFVCLFVCFCSQDMHSHSHAFSFRMYVVINIVISFYVYRFITCLCVDYSTVYGKLIKVKKTNKQKKTRVVSSPDAPFRGEIPV